MLGAPLPVLAGAPPAPALDVVAPVLAAVALVLVAAAPPVPALVVAPPAPPVPALDVAPTVPALELAPPAPPVPLGGVHVPSWQVPPVHGVPSVWGGLEHVPLVESQVPATWHSSEAVHTTGVPVQAPAWHVSAVVHASSSSQVVPVSTVHVPSALAPAFTLHAWQSVTSLPPQALSQQTASTQ